MDKCFDISGFQKVIGCQPLMLTINSNCQSHPNELLACNDSRLPQYPLMLKNAKEEQIRKQKEAYDAKVKAFETKIEELKKNYYSKAPEAVGSQIIDLCVNVYGSSENYAKGVFCDGELRTLHKDCQEKSLQFYYCDDKRLIGYITQFSSTIIPHSNLTVNSSSSNSTYP